MHYCGLARLSLLKRDGVGTTQPALSDCRTTGRPSRLILSKQDRIYKKQNVQSAPLQNCTFNAHINTHHNLSFKKGCGVKNPVSSCQRRLKLRGVSILCPPSTLSCFILPHQPRRHRGDHIWKRLYNITAPKNISYTLPRTTPEKIKSKR